MKKTASIVIIVAIVFVISGVLALTASNRSQKTSIIDISSVEEETTNSEEFISTKAKINNSIDTEIMNLKRYPIPAESEMEIVEITTSKDNDFLYTTTKYAVTPGYVNMTSFADSDNIFPGALIKGDSILEDEYSQIIVNRKPLIISTSMLGDKKDEIEVTVEDPKLSTVRQAINDLLSNNKLKGNSNLILDMFEVRSVEEIQLKAGMRKFPLKAGFDFENYGETSLTVVKFIQEYYTLDVDIPAKPSDFIYNIEDLDIFGNYSPVYISSVTYGRMGLLLIESDYSSNDVILELEASLKDISLSDLFNLPKLIGESDKIMESTNITAYISGGSGEDSVKAINGFDGFKEYIIKGGEFSKDSPGVPISYKMKYLDDNSEVKIAIEKEYELTERTPLEKEIEYKIYLEYIDAFNCGESSIEITDLNIKHGDSLPFFEQIKKINVDKGTVYSYATDYITIDELEDILNKYSDKDYEDVHKYLDKMLDNKDIEKYLDKIIDDEDISNCIEDIEKSLKSIHVEWQAELGDDYIFLGDGLNINDTIYTTFINVPGTMDVVDLNIRLIDQDFLGVGNDIYESSSIENINGMDISEGISTFKIKAYKQSDGNDMNDYIEFNFIVHKITRNVEE